MPRRRIGIIQIAPYVTNVTRRGQPTIFLSGAYILSVCRSQHSLYRASLRRVRLTLLFYNPFLRHTDPLFIFTPLIALSMTTLSTDAEYIGVLPSKMNGKVGDLDHAYENGILDIAASFIRALDYSPPPYSQDPALKAAAVEELESWNVGEALDGFMKYLDMGLAAAEVRLWFVGEYDGVPSYDPIALLPRA